MKPGTLPAYLAIAALFLACASSVSGFTKDYFIWDMDGNNNGGPGIQNALTGAGYTGDRSSTLPAVATLLDYRTVWVCMGMFPNNAALIEYPSQVTTLCTYLDADSTCAYAEGGDMWNTDPWTAFRDYFKLLWGHPGSSDLGVLTGRAGSFAEGMVFDYSGDNAFVDRLLIDTGYSGFYLFDNDNPVYAGMVGYDNGGGTYKTVASSFELAGLDDGTCTKAELADAIMVFFGVPKIAVNNDVALVNLTAPPDLTVPNSPVMPACVVQNNGLLSSAGFYAHMYIAPGGYDESTYVAPLAPDSSVSVTFTEWWAGNVGQQYTVTAWTNWPSDQRPANDSLTKQVAAWDDRWYIKSPWCSTGADIVIDGIIDPVEWAGATVRDVSDFLGRRSQQPPGMAMLHVMNDSSNLYLGLDAVLDHSNTDLDGWGMYFEDNFDRSWPLFPDSSEGGLQVVNHPPPNSPWFRYTPFFADTFAAGYWIAVFGWCDNASGNMQYELRIPIGDTILSTDTTGRHHALNASLCDTVGYWMVAADEGSRQIFAWWPTSSGVGFGNLNDMGMIILNCGLDRYVELEVVSIVSPPSPATPGLDYPVTVRVRNNGTSSETFTVYSLIGDMASPEYYDSSLVSNLASDSTFDATMSWPWHVPNVDTTWPMCAWVAVGDSNPANDTICKDVRVGIAELLSDRRPSVFSLSQNAPNPFGYATRLAYTLPHSARVSLRVFDVSGRDVRTLLDGDFEPGVYTTIWDGKDRSGSRLPGGVYFVRMNAGSFIAVKKVTLLK